MYDITGDKDEVLKIVGDTIRALEAPAPTAKTARARGVARAKASVTRSQRDRLVDALRAAHARQQTKKGARALGRRALVRAARGTA
jgi:hypothetical protein